MATALIRTSVAPRRLLLTALRPIVTTTVLSRHTLSIGPLHKISKRQSDKRIPHLPPSTTEAVEVQASVKHLNYSTCIKHTTSGAFPRASSQLQHLEAGFSFTTGSCILLSLLLLAIGAHIIEQLDEPIHSSETDPNQHLTSPATMTGEIQPGRPGTLTPEEEVKLRELWLLSSRLFGALEPTTSNPPTETEAPPAASVAPKEEKKGFRFLRRKKTEAQPDSSPPSGATTAADLVAGGSSANDKHGQAALFKEAMANSTPEELREAFWQMVKLDHPDGLLLRFLRARKWDVNAAQVMAISALHWRLTDAKVDSEIMFKGEQGMLDYAQSSNEKERKLGNDFMEQIRLGKSFVRGVDKQGRPCCYIRTRLHHAGDQCEESLERFTVHTIETARLMLHPPVDTAVIVFDMTDFGLSNMDYAPVKFMIKCFEANYPESLGAVLIHKAPWVFQGIWKVIRGWLDPVVASKVHFTNNLNDVSQFIPQENVIHELGGPDKYTYEYLEPVPGENDSLKDTEKRSKLEEQRKELAKEYEDSIKEWATLATTDKAGWDTMRAKRDEIAKRLKDNYWALDPFVRAKSLYDRNGEMSKEGAKAAATSSE